MIKAAYLVTFYKVIVQGFPFSILFQKVVTQYSCSFTNSIQSYFFLFLTKVVLLKISTLRKGLL